MPLPPFEASGDLLPRIYPADWGEIVLRFGTNAHRRKLLEGLVQEPRLWQEFRASTKLLKPTLRAGWTTTQQFWYFLRSVGVGPRNTFGRGRGSCSPISLSAQLGRGVMDGLKAGERSAKC